MSDIALHTFTSHVAGKNAIVKVYEDRVEWESPGSVRKGLAVATMGLTAVAPGLRKGAGAEMMPIKAITSVTTKKGLRNTKLVVVAAGNTIEANISHDEAAAVKATILRLMAG